MEKRKLARIHFPGHGRVLEIGCSTGNIAPAFGPMDGVSYLGVDIDPAVIEYARKVFSRIPGFDFRIVEAARPDFGTAVFDYVLIAGVLHHVGDEDCRKLVSAAADAAQHDGIVVVSEPLLPQPEDPFLVRQFIRLEQGAHVRTESHLRSLLSSVPGVRIIAAEQSLIGATPVGWPKVARFSVFALKKA